MTRKIGMEFVCGAVTLVLAAVALVLFGLSYTTGYYTFGQMQSGIIAALLGGGLVSGIAALVLRRRLPDKLWPKLITFAVTGLFSGAAALILGDRVEGIGNCIVTDYDSGHGGEEAIYLSLAAIALLLAAVVYNLIGSFAADRPERKPHTALLAGGFGVSAVAVLLAVLLPTADLLGLPGGGAAAQAGGTYTVSFNQAAGNTETMPDYQFLCGGFKGILKADSRMYVDITLTLDGNGNYSLFSDGYVVEAGKRAEIGDDTGLGMVLTMNAEGTYVTNEDGTVTTSVPTHAVLEMATDTYSAQMKESVGMAVGEHTEDGVYDSADEPAVLDLVPETVWTLGEGTIETYRDASSGGGTYTVSFNQAAGNAETVPDYQFLCGNFGGILRADSRMYVDVTLTLDGSGNYTLFSDGYVIEAGKRAEIGDDTGLGMVLTMNAEGTYVTNEDGTVTTSVPTHAVLEMATDTYSAQMKESVGMAVGEHTEDGVYDSADEPAVLDLVPETVWTLESGSIVTWGRAGETGGAESADDGDAGNNGTATGGLTIISDDGATTMTFYADGTYLFAFESYGIEDAGTYTYEGGVLTLTDANGAQTAAEGDPLALHYVSAVSEQLTGDFTIPAADLSTLLSGGGESETGEGLTVASDDGATTMTFYADGTYLFAFASYGIEDAGTYVYEGGVLTLTDANGAQTTAEGDPLALHYVSTVSEQLTGDFTIPAADLSALLSGGGESETGEGLTVASDDGATTMTFHADGTYLFAFASYGIEDAGTYVYEGGVLTLTDANGAQTTAEGDPLALHYVSAVSEQLTGDFTIPAADLGQ